VQILAISTPVHNACVAGDLTTAEELSTQEINACEDNHNSYATRSLLAARKGNWDRALDDALQVIYANHHVRPDIG
jgi:hypothetical protein